MLAPFLGFGPRAHDWFRGLEADNSKAYFETHRAVWETEVRGPLERLLEELAAELGGSVRMFRPHRDTRFSKNKSPYKTNTYGVARMPDTESGLYVSIGARGLHAGSGYWRMAPSGPATAAMQASGLTLWGASLKTAPRGRPRDPARVHLLRMTDCSRATSSTPGRRSTADTRRTSPARSGTDRAR